MSSWDEYKKKKKGDNKTSSNNSEMSSWQKYKQEKQNPKKEKEAPETVKLPTANKTNKENDISNIFENFGYGLSNGLISLQQQFERVTKKGINDRFSAGDKINSKLNLPTSQDMLKNMLGENSDKPITNIGKKIEKQKQTNTENIQKNIENSSNIVTKKLSEASSSIGEMAPGMLPGIGSIYFTGSAAGKYYDEAKQRGMSEKEAEKYSAIMGLAEGGAEALGGKITKSIGKNLIKGKSKEALKMFGLDILENFAEEAVMEPLSEATATVTAGKDKADWNNIGKRMLQSGVDGAIVATLMGGASAGIGSSVNIINKVAKGEKVTSNDINTAKNDLQNKMTDADVQEKIKEAEAIISSINGIESNNIVENKQETLYNNNESESGINGRIDEGTNLGGNIGESRLLEKREQKQVREQEYREWEKSIQPKQESNFTDEERQLKQEIEKTENKKIVFIESDNEKGYYAGSSLDNRDVIYINSEKAKNFGLKRTAYHESMESNIRFVDSTTQDIILSTITDIINDESFDAQKMEFWDKQEGAMPSDTAIAKDIICDRYAELRGEKLDYKNVLSDELNNRINMSIEYFNQELTDASSFNFPTLENKLTRHDVIQKYRQVAKENITNISEWKDKKSGLKYQLETMERNMYDIIPNKEEAKKMNATYFEPIHSSEAEKQKFINSYNDRIKEFKLNKYEAEAVQVLGEQKHNPSFDAKEAKEVLDNVKENIKKGKIDEQKVDKAIENFREIYDELFELENNILRQNGYKEKPYRKGYFPHFIDYVAETRTEKILDKLGFKIDKRPLPTDIAGITEQFVPGKTWNRSALERKTNKTDYNALKGFDTYIAQASDNIFHTENIQRLRGLENEIRYQYSEKGIQERIDNILNDESLYEDEKQDLIDSILEQANNPVPNLVTELRRYTNALANKKSEADRSIENKIGRPIYSTVNAIENRFAANAVGLNIGSALTNFIPITQAYSQVGTKNMTRAMIDTVKSYVTDDGFSNKSTFLTNRIKQSEKLYKTSIEKISDKSSFLFNAIDEVTSNIVVRSKYLENIAKGMNESEAMRDADSFARKVIGSRSKGSLPTIFEEKNPITKMFTQFQLEVNNQYRYMFKDLPRDLAEKGLTSIALAFFKMFVGAWLYNIISEKVIGRKAAFSPIDLVSSAYENITDNNKKTYDKVADIVTDIGEQTPFVGGFFGGGRVPVSGAIPNVANLTKAGIGLMTGEMDSKKASDTLKKEISKPLYYLLPPFGGGQLKKSIEGISTVANGGSFGIDSQGNETLQFPVENASTKDYVQAGIFGKYSLPIAREYQNRNFKSLTAKQTETYKETNLPYKEYLQYIDANLDTKREKLDYLNKQDWKDNQKWGIFTRDILSSTERKDGSSQLSDAEYIISTGFSKSKYINLYNKAYQNDISMPTEKEYKELRKEAITLEEYINDKIKKKNNKK